jgi:hypothetical protein
MGREVEDPNALIAEQRQRRKLGKPPTGEAGELQSGKEESTEKQDNGKVVSTQTVIEANRESEVTVKPQDAETESQQTGKPEELQSANTVTTYNMKTGKRESGKEESPQPRQIGERQSTKAGATQQGIAVKPDSKKTGTKQNGKAKAREDAIAEETESGSAVVDEEKATEKITLYLSWRQLDKLDEMVRGYKRRMRKRTDQNKLMRMMIDKFTLDDILTD